jgi:hypothetical protein
MNITRNMAKRHRKYICYLPWPYQQAAPRSSTSPAHAPTAIGQPSCSAVDDENVGIALNGQLPLLGMQAIRSSVVSHHAPHHQVLTGSPAMVRMSQHCLPHDAAHNAVYVIIMPSCRSDQAPTAVPYPTHVPLNPLQKGAVAGLSALGALLRCDSTMVYDSLCPVGDHVACQRPQSQHVCIIFVPLLQCKLQRLCMQVHNRRACQRALLLVNSSTVAQQHTLPISQGLDRGTVYTHAQCRHCLCQYPPTPVILPAINPCLTCAQPASCLP